MNIEKTATPEQKSEILKQLTAYAEAEISLVKSATLLPSSLGATAYLTLTDDSTILLSLT